MNVDFLSIISLNYRQADAVVVVAAAAAAAAAGQLFSDHADRLPHQAVDWHVTVGRPRPPNPFRDSSTVCGRFR